jgi:hypothetical protein
VSNDFRDAQGRKNGGSRTFDATIDALFCMADEIVSVISCVVLVVPVIVD